MDNKIIDKILCEKMNFTPEQIDTITFICKEVYKEMESNKGIQNDYSNFANEVAVAEPIKKNMKKEATESRLALNRKFAMMRNVFVIMEYIKIIFGKGGSCVKSDIKTLSIYKNNVDYLISEITDISIDLDYIFKKWEIQLSKISENHKSAKCEIRLSLNNDISISRFFDYRKQTWQRIIFALILYMKLRFKSKGWDLDDVFFKDFPEDVSGILIQCAGEILTPCVVFKFIQIKNKHEPKLTVKSKGGKK